MKLKQDTLIKKYKEEQKTIQEQKELHAKHKIQDENTIIVEKKSATKYMVLAVSNVLQIIATITILGLAMIGIISIAYTPAREILLGLIKLRY